MLDKNGILFCVLNNKTKKTADTIKTVIGLPRYILYSKEGRVWQSFLTMLGCSTFVSSEASAKTVVLGETLLKKESSRIAKIIAGELIETASNSDIICVLKPIPFEVTDILEDLKAKNKKVLYIGSSKEELEEVAKLFSLSINSVLDTFNAASKSKEQKFKKAAVNGEKSKILLLGCPFIINDSFINHGLVKKINSFGFCADTSENFKTDEKIEDNIKGIITVMSDTMENKFEYELASDTPHLVISADGIKSGIELENTLETFLSSIK